MNLDLKTQHDNFVVMSFEEKRNAVMTLLEGIQAGNQLFADLYVLVSSDVAVEQDFFDIFDSLMIVLYQDEMKSEQLAMLRLHEIKDTLVLQKEKEAKEKLAGVNEALTLIGGMI